MIVQQMEYVVAVDTYRHFVKAAESCNVSQSTLSMMIKKVEEELDTPIFDRDSHPIRRPSVQKAVDPEIRALHEGSDIQDVRRCVCIHSQI